MPKRPDRSSLGLASLVALLTLGCGENPCPRGWRRSPSEDRCIEATPDGGDTPFAPPPDMGDGALAPRAPDDADTGQASPTPPPDAGSDASTDGGDADAPDAEVDAPCSDGDLDAWRAFQLSGSAVTTTASCVDATPGCPGPTCELHACLADRAGVTSCRACVAEQVACTASACFEACSPGRADDECRACACAAGCAASFERCAGRPLDVCADCSGDRCSMQSLDPALIMVIIS